MEQPPAVPVVRVLAVARHALRTLNLVETDVVDDHRLAILWCTRESCVRNRSAPPCLLQVVDDVGVEVSSITLSDSGRRVLEILKNKRQRLPFVARALAHSLTDGSTLQFFLEIPYLIGC